MQGNRAAQMGEREIEVFSTNIDVQEYLIGTVGKVIGVANSQTVAEGAPCVFTDLHDFTCKFNRVLKEFGSADLYEYEDRKLGELYDLIREVKSYCKGVNAYAGNNVIGMHVCSFAYKFRNLVYQFLEAVATSRRFSGE